ncbi:hypothetical protein T4E_3380 [Trichinella pseudospiralis]|uniref:Uncharacterized protein n=1 Tax=Trichinella pseudospiralis TaxID=6337 RepID=A0A0V0YAN8_TRIPS|nr:hypothetical protein T4E_3380 [Trichinella pseudospiralis]
MRASVWKDLPKHRSIFEVLYSKAEKLGVQLDPEISENANGISIFASKPCTHGFRNLKYWDIRSSINLVPVIPVGVASSH